MTTENQIVTNIDHPDDDVIAAALLNVTIMAADRRCGRRMLNSNDFRSFKAMLAASNGIQPVLEQGEQMPPVQQQQRDAITNGLEAVAKAIEQNNTTPPPNAFV